MRLNSGKFAATIILSALLVLIVAGAAFAAPPWSDASDTYWATNYGVTSAAVATVADGYPDGTFRPGNSVTRGQFAKMAVSGLDVPTANPATASFNDVAKGSTFYVYVEGAKAAGMISGTTASTFSPNSNISRQQANTILGRYLSQIEIDTLGYIKGDGSLTYPTLSAWYAANGDFYLSGYSDWTSIAVDHRATTAYLVYREVVQGSAAGKLNPTATLNRAQAAAMVLRVADAASELSEAPPAPTNLSVVATGEKAVTQTGVSAYIGNDATPQVKGMAIVSSPIAVYDTFGGATNKLTENLTTNAAGWFYADLVTPLTDGTHSFTAKVKNGAGLLSAASMAVSYVLDTVLPTAAITAPVVTDEEVDAAVNTAKPTFTVTATDDRSGVKQVDFQVAADVTTPAWQSVSIDTAPEASTALYVAVWPTTGTLAAGLADGQYLFRAIVTDNAGNQLTTATTKVTVDTTAPIAQIAAGSLVAQGVDGVFYSENRSPQFGGIATDTTGGAAGTLASGVTKVEFLYAPNTTPPTTWTDFTLISSDLGSSGFAVYPTDGIVDGSYLFAVRATDRAGNQSILGAGSPLVYTAGSTRPVVIDNAAPVVTITAPTAAQLVPDSTSFNITWTLSDVSAPASVKIEYSDDNGDNWSTIAAAAPFTPGSTGSYVWTTPAMSGADLTHYKVRLTAIDKVGTALAKTGAGQGHYTQTTSLAFTLYDEPLAPTGETAADNDTNTGIDGRDFHAEWTVSASPHIASQRVYVLPTAQTLALTDIPLATFNDNTTATWTGISTQLADSRGVALVAGAYKIWVVATDPAGRTASVSADITAVAD